MCGVSAGERSIYGIREFARLKEQWLRNVIGLKLPNRLPSYDTVRRVLGILDTKQFQHVFWNSQKASGYRCLNRRLGVSRCRTGLKDNC